MTDHLSDALRDWAQVLGPGSIVRGRGLSRYTANVTAYERTIPAALLVQRRDQVASVVAIARAHDVPLYPISTGHNWGLGSRLPARDGAVVVDLAGMDRILALDLTTNTVVVEPGVTQGQLAVYLAAEAPDLVANMTGSAAATSVLGNTVDRGIGYLASRTDDVVGLEVVLGNGQTLRTGEWPTAGSHYGPHWHHGIGPSLDGLFVQSNFGIVTALALRLRPRPQATTAFRMSVRGDHQVVRLLDELATLRRDSVLTMPTRIFDGIWTHGSLEGPEPAWTAFGGLTGRGPVVEAMRREVERALDPLGTLEFASVDETSSPDLPETESSWWRSVLSVMNGRPTDLSVTNWASRVGVEFDHDDLDASDFGMLCDVRAIPFSGPAGFDATTLARKICAPYGLQPCVSLSALDGYSLEAVFILLFNRASAERTAAAHACSSDLRAELTDADLVPHRIAIDEIPAFVAPHETYWETVAAIKRSLDPALIIAPGRYSLL